MADAKTSDDAAWVQVQKKTFTKWSNNHLRKKGYPALNQIQDEFEDGINLMRLINALYGIELPKYNKAPKLRPHKLDNISLALSLVEQAQIKTNFLKPTHLADKDLKMILGMIWAIILDYQIKGISVEELTAKEGLLLWCQKKTHGYKDVKIENFSNSWRDGLGFCALIHRHRPDLLDFSKLDKSNAAHNLELAFDVAEKHLGIPRLLDVADILDSPKPDERSVMTYVSEYFHCFASQDVKEVSARRIQKFVQFQQGMEDLEKQYEKEATALVNWIHSAIERMGDRHFGETLEEAKSHFEAHKQYLSVEKPQKVAAKLDQEALYVSIQTKLQVYNRNQYTVPPGLGPDEIDALWNKLEQAERERGAAVRQNRFRFIQKAESTISDEQMREFENAYKHFDKDKDGALDKLEFRAALSALSIPFRDEEAFNQLFERVSGGNPVITREQFMQYMIEISEDKDTPDQIKQSFALLSGSPTDITRTQLIVPPLTDSEQDYLSQRMPGEGEVYNYSNYVNTVFI